VVGIVCAWAAGVKGKIVLKMKKPSLILLVLVGLLGVSSVALAGHDDEHVEDTQFSFGYDLTNHLLAINIGPNWDPYVCDFENGELTATYGEAVEGVIPITDLEDSGSGWTFDAREEGLVDGEAVAEPASVPYDGADGVCGVNGVVVAGPNGQINHGQFMKAAKTLFNSLYEIKGHGCIVRLLANSNIGKGNDPSHLTVTEAEASGFVFGGADTTGEIDFTTVEADCNRGNKDKGTAAATTSSGKTKGKSADAPGHNK
jgi:hypothetical protein